MSRQRLLTIVQDRREQAPLAPLFPASVPARTGGGTWTVEVVPGTLDAGDYALLAFPNGCVIERKGGGVDEIAQNVTTHRERFERELVKLAACEQAIIFIEGTSEDIHCGGVRSQISPQSFEATIDSIALKYGIGCHFCTDRENMARRVLGALRRFAEKKEAESNAPAQSGQGDDAI